MRTTYKVIFSIAFLGVLGSCSDDLREVTPTSIIAVNSFFKTSDDAQGALFGMYIRLRDQGKDRPFYLWGECRAQTGGFGIQATGVGETEYSQYFFNILTPTLAGVKWRGLYTVIHDANLLIQNVPNIEFPDDKQKNSILAQAHATRALVYFVMGRTWGGVPLVLEPTQGFDPGNQFKTRASEEEVFALIKQDIDLALSLFPDNTITGGRNTWSKPAVNAMKGDVYLWTAKVLGGGSGDLTIALAALTEASNSAVALLTNYDDVFDFNNKGNPEILMSSYFEEFEETSSIYSDMYVRGDQIPSSTPQEVRDAVLPGTALNRLAPNQHIRDQFSRQDSRRWTTFQEIWDFDANGDSAYVSAVMYKFRGEIIDNGNSRIHVDDYILYRYADVLLLIAEAKNGLGQDPTVEMNMVRERAWGSNFVGNEFVSGSQSDNDDAILQERLFELAFEGKRWWDLVRFNKAFELVPSLVGREGNQGLLRNPIAQEAISLNPALTQNPGY